MSEHVLMKTSVSVRVSDKKKWESANLHVICLALLSMPARSLTYACFLSIRL